MIKKSFFTVGLLLLVLFAFLLLPNREITLIIFAIAFVSSAYFLALISWWRKKSHEEVRRRVSPVIALLSLFFLSLPFIFGAFLFFLQPLNLSSVSFAISTAGFALTLFYDFLNIPLALYHKHREEELEKQPIREYPLVSIIVPAHNEEKCIEGTIESLLEINYPNKEIIIVDDGSTDRTYALASMYIPKGVKVLHRSRGGKWAALNYGILFSKGEIIVTIDADSLISRTALIEIVKRFQDPRVKAVCGNVKVLNRNNLLTKCQALEYIADINIAKRAFDIVGSTMVVPGVLGAFRRDVLVSTGTYDPDTVTEDFDVTIKALKTGAVVQTTRQACAYTEVPETLKDLYRQRSRWYKGTAQVLIKHRDALLHPTFGFLSFLGFPYVLLSIIFIPLCGVLALTSGIIASLTGSAIPFLQLLSLFILMELLFSILAIQLDGEDMKLALYSPLFVVGYRHFRDIIRIKSLIEVVIDMALKKKRVEWRRVERKGIWREKVAKVA